jgi:hydroxyacylglutathione hydrolase
MEVHLLKALKDNYNFILRPKNSDLVFVIDPSEKEPTSNFIRARGWALAGILNTHHHWDHTGGNGDLQREYSCPVYGFAGDLNRNPSITVPLQDNQVLQLGSLSATVLHIPGHTTGQVAFWFPQHTCVFVGDTLFNFGCGRVFEGSYEQMFISLKRLKQLPAATRVYCGHEYTLRNLEFLLSLDSNNQKLRDQHAHALSELARGGYTVPFQLGPHLDLNPFLTDDFLSFCNLRDLRNAF